jgi:hypothetical protein
MKELTAPRGVLSYSRSSREEFGGRFLGLMAYSGPKGVPGDNSMPVKQRVVSRYGSGALRDPSDMVNSLTA